MEKNNKPVLVGIILILAIAVVYLLATRGQEGGYDDLDSGNLPPQAETAGMEEPVGGEEENTPNYMEHQIPAPLTEAQKAQLAVGAEAHEPKEITFDVTGGSFYFTPNEISVKQGDRVKIIFTNAGGMHNLVLPDFGVETKMTQTGETDTIEFTADKKGTFEFYCEVGNGYHRQMGQIGVLLVE